MTIFTDLQRDFAADSNQRQEPYPMTTPSDPNAPVNAPRAAGPAPMPQRKPSTLAQIIHHAVASADRDRRVLQGALDGIGHAVTHALPLIEKIAINPAVDELVETALRALDAGVAAEVVQTASDMLRSAIDRQAPPSTGPQQAAGPQSPAQPATGNGGPA